MDARTTWPALLSALLTGENLTADEAAWAMNEIMSGSATSAQIAGFAVALRAKGETVAEVTGLARTMLERATPLTVEGPIVDVVGTGGDRAHTVNVSTMAAIVAAAAGARVVKHGNRAASSSCGAADVLEHLGIMLDLSPADTAKVAVEVGIAFCFAPVYHPALRFAGPPRKELGIPTVFNFLGPLTNPARPTAQAIGIFDPGMLPVVAGVFAERGCPPWCSGATTGWTSSPPRRPPRSGWCARGPPRRRSSTRPRWTFPVRGGRVARRGRGVQRAGRARPARRQDRCGPRRGAAQRGGRAGRPGRRG